MLTHVDLTSEDRSTAVELRARQEGVVYTAELLYMPAYTYFVFGHTESGHCREARLLTGSLVSTSVSTVGCENTPSMATTPFMAPATTPGIETMVDATYAATRTRP